MIYLASPYSHADPKIIEARFEYATKVSGFLMNEGSVVFSPITHSHLVAKMWNMPTVWSFWQGQDLHILRRCDSLVVLAIPGWKESVGVQAEIEFAEDIEIPISMLYPEKLPHPLNVEFPKI